MAEQSKDRTEKAKDEQPPPVTPTEQPRVQMQPSGQLQVRWDDANMTTSYANVVNVASTREEVTLFFGTNQTWNIVDTRELTVQLSNRVVVNPYAAKRLWTLLGNVLTEYEKRFGSLNIESGNGAGGAGN